MYIHDLITRGGGLITAEQMQAVMSRKMFRTLVRSGDLVRVCHGVYGLRQPDTVGKLAALDLMVGCTMVACMGTAASLHGFDTEKDPRVHVLDPDYGSGRPTGSWCINGWVRHCAKSTGDWRLRRHGRRSRWRGLCGDRVPWRFSMPRST